MGVVTCSQKSSETHKKLGNFFLNDLWGKYILYYMLLSLYNITYQCKAEGFLLKMIIHLHWWHVAEIGYMNDNKAKSQINRYWSIIKRVKLQNYEWFMPRFAPVSTPNTINSHLLKNNLFGNLLNFLSN